MPFFFTEESLNANITSFWSTYMQEISRQGDLLREAEVVPLCHRLDLGFVSHGNGAFNFYSNKVEVFDINQPDFRRVWKLLSVKVPGTVYKLGAFVGDVEIGGD